MPKRLNVLYLPPPPHLEEPWQRDIIEAVGPRHHLKIFDCSLPLEEQFEGINVVLDFGGSCGTRQMADAATFVQLWQILGTGFDHFDLDYWRTKEIPVANCPGQFSAAPLAECAMLFMLLLARNWERTQQNLKSGRMCLPTGLELAERTLGLIGFGASARELATRAHAFRMRVLAIDRNEISFSQQRRYGLAFAGKPTDIDSVVGQSDYLSLHLHFNAETRHIIDARRIGLMKPGACLINVARGALVDEPALENALREGRLGGAALDVFSTEPVDPDLSLLKLLNVVATPHISGVTDGTSRRRAACAAKNLGRIAAGLPPLYRID